MFDIGQSEEITCYLQGGVPAPDGIPCTPNSLPSLCCVAGWYCNSNGLCMPPSNFSFGEAYGRGACTDPFWNTSACFGGCNNATGTGVRNCGLGWGCCDGSQRCDCTTSNTVSYGIGTVVASLSWTTPTTIASNSTTSTASISQGTLSTSPSTRSRLSTGARAGIGVGVIIGGLLVLVAVIGYLRRLYRRKTPNSSAENDIHPYIGNTVELEDEPVQARVVEADSNPAVMVGELENSVRVFELGSHN